MRMSCFTAFERYDMYVFKKDGYPDAGNGRDGKP